MRPSVEPSDGTVLPPFTDTWCWLDCPLYAVRRKTSLERVAGGRARRCGALLDEGRIRPEGQGIGVMLAVPQ